MHPLLLLPALISAPVQAQDVLVPEFTPVIAEDFTLAYMFYSLVIDELRQRDVAFIDGDQLRTVAGEEAESCSESITCPSGLWSYFPGTTIALVGTVGLYNMGTASESIEVRVEFYERDGGYQAFKTVERTIVPGQEADFAVALAKATDVLVERMTAPPEPVADPDAGNAPGPENRREGLLARRNKEPERSAPAEPEDPGESLYKDYYAVEEPESGRRKDREPRAEREPREPKRKDVGRVSTREPRERKERTPREPRERSPREPSGDSNLLVAQAFAGLAIGDVGRSYDVRLSVMGAQDAELGRYEHDTFTSGVGSTFGGGLMVQPFDWLQAGARLGVVSGRKFLSTGYERWSDGDGNVETQEYKPAAALRGVIEPRIAVAPIAFGPVRPNVHAFFGIRRYDAYDAADLSELAYPDRNGGWHFLPGAGLGASYDLGQGRGVTLELSHAVRLGADAVHHVQQGLISEIPEIPDPASHNTTIAVGFTQGFM